jgi:hypothetical protein
VILLATGNQGAALTTEELYERGKDDLIDLLAELERVKEVAEEVLMARLRQSSAEDINDPAAGPDESRRALEQRACL